MDEKTAKTDKNSAVSSNFFQKNTTRLGKAAGFAMFWVLFVCLLVCFLFQKKRMFLCYLNFSDPFIKQACEILLRRRFTLRESMTTNCHQINWVNKNSCLFKLPDCNYCHLPKIAICLPFTYFTKHKV